MLLKVLAVFCFFFGGELHKALAAETFGTTYLNPIEVRAHKKSKKSIGISENSRQSIELENNQSPTLSQVLEKSESLFVQESGTVGAPRIFIRAHDPIENRYFLEGVPLTDAQYNAEQITLLSTQALGRVDIYPDSVPASLGADGLGGAIDFHLNSIDQNLVNLKMGSFGYRELFGKATLGKELGNLNLSLIRSDENYTYYDDGGTPFNDTGGTIKNRDHNRFVRIGLIPNLSLFHGKDLEINYFGINGLRSLEIPGSISLPLEGKLNQWFHLSNLSFENRLSERSRNKLWIYARIDSQKYQSETKEKSLAAPESNQSLEQAVGLRNQLQWHPFFPVKFEHMLGGNYEQYKLVSTDNSLKRFSNSRLEIPASLSVSIPMKSIELKPAVLLHSTFYQGKYERKYLVLSPRLGAELTDLANVRNLTGQVSLGRFFRSPSMQELNGNAYGLAASKDLNAEQADKLCAGMAYSIATNDSWLSHLKLSYAYSLAFSRELITYVRNSQNSQVATNVGNSTTQSHESSLELKFYRFIDLNTRVVIFIGKNLSDLPYHYGKQLPLRPKYRLLERIGYVGERLGLAYQLQFVGQRYWDLANTKQMNSTLEHGFFLNFSPPKWGQFNLEVLNLFDTFIANSTLSGFQVVDNTTGYLGYPAPGRRVYLSWSYEI